MTTTEFLPLHPPRSSAGRRRRHLKQLQYRLQLLLPGAVVVLITPVCWTDAGARPERAYHLCARNADGTPVRPAPGVTPRVAALLQGAFPAADWDRAHTWHADGNRLTAWATAPTREVA